jgi:hypothetical protein
MLCRSPETHRDDVSERSQRTLIPVTLLEMLRRAQHDMTKLKRSQQLLLAPFLI